MIKVVVGLLTAVLSLTMVLNPVYAQTSSFRINWLAVCRNTIVDAVISEPCETLTTPDGYDLTPAGQRVVACVLGAGVLLAYDQSGATLAAAQEIANTTGICGNPTTTSPTNPTSPTNNNYPKDDAQNFHGDSIPSCSGDYYHPCK